MRGILLGLIAALPLAALACQADVPAMQHGDENRPQAVANWPAAPVDNHGAARPVSRATGRAEPPDFAQRTAEVTRRMPAYFRIRAQAPFVVATDMGENALEQTVSRTLIPGYQALLQRYIATPPSATLAVWLFQDRKSYEDHTLSLFNETPFSPFGYFKPSTRDLVMNISTGGGTLLHEMTHALMLDDFPNVPIWFSEGFASMWEGCEFAADGNLIGRPNWRLKDLSQALKRGSKLPRIAELCAMERGTFLLGARMRLNYACSRYLCMALQEKGLLTGFYKDYRKAHADGTDLTGALTLEKYLGPLDEYDAKYLEFVCELIEANMPPEDWPPARER